MMKYWHFHQKTEKNRMAARRNIARKTYQSSTWDEWNRRGLGSQTGNKLFSNWFIQSKKINETTSQFLEMFILRFWITCLHLASREGPFPGLEDRGLLALVLQTAKDWAKARARSVDVLLPIRPPWRSLSADIPHMHIMRNCLHIGQVSPNLPPTIANQTALTKSNNLQF